MKQTVVVNLFGAPGSGKSSGATYIFSRLKMRGIDSEYVSEFAKDKCWEGNKFIFSDPENQFYIGAKQFYKMNLVAGKVDVIVTDSPLLLGTFYNNSTILGDDYNLIVTRLFNKFKNLNFYVNRVKDYNPNGRNQTKEQADELSINMRLRLGHLLSDITDITGCENGYDTVFDSVISYLNNRT